MNPVDIHRPKNGHELIELLKKKKQFEVVDSHAFVAAKVIEEHYKCSYTFKLSRWNKGWAGFSRI